MRYGKVISFIRQATFHGTSLARLCAGSVKLRIERIVPVDCERL